MTLVEFLLARISEDEAAARAADGLRWQPGDGNVSEGGLYALDDDGSDPSKGWAIAWFELGWANSLDEYGGPGPKRLPAFSQLERHAHENSVHAARWDPARVLAECASKRQLIEGWGEFETYNGERLLMVMAAVYASHPDYDESWAV